MPTYKARHCETCDEKFIPEYASAVCCSEECAKVRKRILAKEARITRKAMQKRINELENENKALRDELASVLDDDSEDSPATQASGKTQKKA